MFAKAFRVAVPAAKIMFRGKAFWAVGVLLPLISVLLINVWANMPVTAEPTEEVHLLENPEEQLVYDVDFNRFAVKVYDKACTIESKDICEGLNDAGMFQIFVADVKNYPDEKIRESAEKSALEDKVGAILILGNTAEESCLYSVGEDERFALLEELLPLVMGGYDESYVNSDISLLADNTNDEVNYYESRELAYTLAFASIAFIFGGVMILGTVLDEKRDHVYERMMLTGVTRTCYFTSKLILCIGLALLQTVLMTLGLVFFVKVEIGITAFRFFTVLLLIGVVFNLMSLCIGLFCNSMAMASIVAFCIWSISALVSGTYFDISSSSDFFKRLASFMPERIALISINRFMRDDLSGYSLIACAALSYLIIIFVVGIIGVKIGEEE